MDDFTDNTPPQGPVPAADTPSVETAVLPSTSSAEPELSAYRIPLLPLSLLALVVGLITGVGAVVFRDLIGLVHNVLFWGNLPSPITRASSPLPTLGGRL